MLDAVTKGFRAAKHKLTGKAELTEANIDDALRDIRVALLEADVEFNVAKRFLARVKEKALGEVVTLSSTDKSVKSVSSKLPSLTTWVGYSLPAITTFGLVIQARPTTCAAVMNMPFPR